MRSAIRLYRAARAGDMKTMRADISLLKSLGYRARVDLATGLDHTVEWFAAQFALTTAEAFIVS